MICRFADLPICLANRKSQNANHRARTLLLIAVTLVLVTSACVPRFAWQIAASVPVSPSPVLLSKTPLQTDAGKPVVVPTAATPTGARLSDLPICLANCKSTQTPASTMTAFPSITPLPPPTETPTLTPFGFVPSATLTPPTPIFAAGETPDPAEGATDDWGSPTRCSLLSKSPPDWTTVPPMAQYKVSWTLLNSGVKTWQANQMVLTFIDGTKLSQEKSFQLKSDVKVGRTITPVINIYPPKASGHYRSVWALRLLKNNHLFCTFTLKITVP
jgi:hypothetical protein